MGAHRHATSMVPSFRNGIDRIGNKVQNDLPDLDAITIDSQWVGASTV